MRRVTESVSRYLGPGLDSPMVSVSNHRSKHVGINSSGRCFIWQRDRFFQSWLKNPLCSRSGAVLSRTPLRLAYRCGNGSGPVSFLNSSTASLSRGMSLIVCSSSSGICGSAFSPVSFVYSFKNSGSL